MEIVTDLLVEDTADAELLQQELATFGLTATQAGEFGRGDQGSTEYRIEGPAANIEKWADSEGIDL